MSTIHRSGRLAPAVLLLVSALVVFGGGSALAAEVTFTATVPVQDTNWAQTVTLPQFDPAQGTLQSVEVTVTGEVAGSAQVENLDPNGPSMPTLDLTATITVDADPGGGVINIPTNPTSSNAANLGPFDLNVDFAGPSGATFPGLSATETQAQTTTDAGVLAAYTGTGNVVLDATATAGSIAVGGGNVVFLFDTDAGATVTVKYTFQPAANPAIDIEKATNGQDADTPTGPVIPVGAPVTWTYVVTNTGDIALVDVVVTDSQGVAVTCPQNTLAVAEAMTCTANGTATAGQYANVGTVTAGSEGGPVTDTDPSHYFGAAPGVDIAKTPDSQTVASGSTVTFTIVVTNTGNVALSNVAVTDPLAPDCSRTIGALAVGASTTYDCTVPAVTAAFTNVATVTGQGPGGQTVTDQDDARVEVPAIDVVKSVNTTAATVGDTLTYTYVITNIGSVTLTNITLVDDRAGPVTLLVTTLAPGQSTTATATYVVTSADAASPPLVNIALVTGRDPTGREVTDTDREEVPTINLQPSTTATTPPTLPRTGGQVDTGPVTSTGVALLLLGGLLVLTAATEERSRARARLAAESPGAKRTRRRRRSN